MEQLNLIIDTYQRIILESESKLAKVKQHIYRIGTLRLILFAAGIAGIIYFWDEGRLVIGGIAAITFIPFILLVKLHNRLFHQKDYLEKKIEINRQELQALHTIRQLSIMGKSLSIHHIFILMIWTYLENIHSFST